MITGFFLIPLLAGLFAFLIKDDKVRRLLLVLTALFHSGFMVNSWFHRPEPFFYNWIALDNIGLLFLSITSIIFLAISFYSVGYLAKERHTHVDYEENIFFSNASEAVFTSFLLLLLSTMSLVTISNNFGLLWVAIEASTLASAPLIYFHRHHRSLEATWKYLMLCSVGIALSLLGNFLLAASLPLNLDEYLSLNLDYLISHPRGINLVFLKTASIFFLVGYGTKMGLAPMHTWVPDTYSESPSVIAAVMGCLSNCCFLAVLRVFQICNATGLGEFCRELLIIFGLFSMGVAAVFIMRQFDYKRLLAYSSIEHMGILTLGIGLGGAATFGSVLHTVNHSLTKAMLFLVAGNILAVYQTKNISEVKGILKTIPISGALWLSGFFSITGFPPFGTFISEFTILKGALEQGYYVVAVIYLILLALIFIGMSIAVLGMAHGEKPEFHAQVKAYENMDKVHTWLSLVPPAVLGAMVLCLGFYLPYEFSSLLTSISKTLGAP